MFKALNPNQTHHKRSQSSSVTHIFDLENLTELEKNAFLGFSELTAKYFKEHDENLKAIKDRLYHKMCTQQGYGDKFLLKYMVARDFNVDKAYKMFTYSFEWRIKNKVSQIPLSWINNPEAKNPFKQLCLSKDGYPIIYGDLKIMEYSMDVNKFNNSVEALFEQVFLIDDPIQTQFIAIFDFTGWSMTQNFNATSFMELISVAQDCYPEMINKIYLTNYSHSLHMVYNILSPLLSKRTQAKLRWLKSDHTEFHQEFPSLEYCPPHLK